MKSSPAHLCALWLLLGIAAADSRVLDAADGEKTAIESLIKHVEQLADAKFVRNDREYDSKAAAKFLQAKWDANASQIKTAEDFIQRVATKSSTTGKPYLIRFKNGSERKSGEYLVEQLKKMRE